MAQKKFDAWFEADIRAAYYAETRRGATPRAWNRASSFAAREQARERRLRQLLLQEHGVEPEELLRRKLAK